MFINIFIGFTIWNYRDRQIIGKFVNLEDVKAFKQFKDTT